MKQFGYMNEWMKDNPNFKTDKFKGDYYDNVMSQIAWMGDETRRLKEKIKRQIAPEILLKKAIEECEESLVNPNASTIALELLKNLRLSLEIQ